MDVTTRWAIAPLLLLGLASGIVQAIGTKWGLLKHYWIMVKLLLIVIATVVLLLQPGRKSKSAAH